MVPSLRGRVRIAMHLILRTCLFSQSVGAGFLSIYYTGGVCTHDIVLISELIAGHFSEERKKKEMDKKLFT